MKDWQSLLVVAHTKSGERILPIAANATVYLSYDERWKGVLAFDAFRETVITTKPPPWLEVDSPPKIVAGEWTDVDTVRAQNWLARTYGIDFSLGSIESAISVAAARDVKHPVKDWLEAIRWDAKKRLDRLFVDYFGAEDSAYVRGVGVRFAIGAVARIYQPGAQVDCTPVLEGPQGIGKSTGMKRLVGADWYFDSPIAMGDKDGYQALRGKWVGALDELHSLSRSDLNRAKSFLTATSDTYRPSYGRRTVDYKRQCVFVGTTNASQWLKDETGNRRFWPIRCGKIDREAIDRDREQLWAEARSRFQSSEPWHVNTEEFRRLCEEQQEERFVTDSWEEVVLAWCHAIDHPERRAPGVLLGEVLQGALNLPKERWGKTEEIRVSAILSRAKWERGERHREDGIRVRRWSPASVKLVVGTPGEPEVGTPETQVQSTSNTYLSPPSPPIQVVHMQENEKPVALLGQAGDSGDGGDSDS